MSKAKVKDIVTRATKTFIQAFIGSFTIDAFFMVSDTDTLKKIFLSVLVASVAAGVSAVWNMLLDFMYKKIDKIMITDEDLGE